MAVGRQVIVHQGVPVMSQSSATVWRGVVLSAVVAVGAGWGIHAHAERVITTSDSGNGDGLATAGVNRLFNCTSNNFPTNPDVPFSCLGAQPGAYNAGTDFGIIEGLVDGRFASWTSTDRSASVAFVSNGKIFFNTELHGNFAFVLSGTWVDNSTLTNQPVRDWSAYYLLEDVGILPNTVNPANAIRLNLDGVDPGPSYYTTNQLSIANVSVYQITAVPEPQSLALVSLGLAGLLLAGRSVRRRRAVSSGL